MSIPGFETRVVESLQKAQLMPSSAPLVPVDFSPTLPLYVYFGDKQVDLGTFFRVSEVKERPNISFPPEVGREGETYTLMLVDPDAPTPDDPKFKWWRHWIVTGLKPGVENISQMSEAVTPYLAPGPKDDSRPHRYLFLLFREPQGFSVGKEDVGGEGFVQRRSFKAAEFVEKHDLKLVGANWMTCAGDGWKES